MDKIILTTEDLKALDGWKDKHQDLVYNNEYPLRAIEMHIVSIQTVVKAIRESHTRLKLYISRFGKSFGYCIMTLNDDGKTWKLTKDTFGHESVSRHDAIAGVLSMYCSLMAVMIYGSYFPIEKPESEEKEDPEPRKSPAKPRKKVKGAKSVTYILHRSGNCLSVGRQGSHASPTGVFTVRGHWRHYQNGNVVWISEYKKGTGEKKWKRYKVGQLPKEE